ncbi:hypothetical protein B0T17DRAFT_510672 [Bombardia bombarda]|uniref:Zn(2)-C6 fungal-type domain-containing protein n=1 Tax=Bombardia bombarda TaxID=252184 RepID=A0AA40BV48_9PEZI|nr:hypothetical protein B0T17DRAFT_510672 [Bombardia bombarda]
MTSPFQNNVMEHREQRSARARRGTTCVHCRKMKLRCDAAIKFPAACSRCSKVDRECTFGAQTAPQPAKPAHIPPDSSSSRIAQLERDLHDIKRRLEDDTTSSVPTSVPSWSGDAAHDHDSPPEYSSGPATGYGFDLSAQQLGGVDMSPADFLELVDDFFAQFHHQFPFIGGKRELVRDCIQCPLLYWAIVSIASKVNPKHHNLPIQLTWPVRRLAADTALKPPSLPLVQALLLLCLWPLPFASMDDDPSWTFVGIATHKALQMALHKSTFERNFDNQMSRLNELTRQTMRSTWLACFILNHCLSFRLAIPPTAHLDPSLLQPRSDSLPLSPILLAAAEICHKESLINSLLAQGTFSTGTYRSRVLVMKTSELELDMMGARLNVSSSPLLEHLFSGTKLRLYSHALLGLRKDGDVHWVDSSTGGSPGPVPVEVVDYISKAYAVVLRAVNISLHPALGHRDSDSKRPATTTRSTVSPAAAAAAAGGASASASASGPAEDATLKNSSFPWTVIDIQELIFSIFVLLRIRHIYPDAADNADTNDALHRGWAFLKSCSVAEGDHFHRLSDIIHFITNQEDPAIENDGSAEANAMRKKTGPDIVYGLIKLASKRYLYSWRKHPSIFPDSSQPHVLNGAGTDAGGGGTSGWMDAGTAGLGGAGGGSGGSDVALADIDFPLWPSLEGDDGYGGAFVFGFQ